MVGGSDASEWIMQRRRLGSIFDIMINEQQTGLVFDIQHFCVHDGPGIRTTVFTKGCSLHCRWCHNPEGMDHTNTARYFAEKCIGCSRCVDTCPHGARCIIDGRLFYQKESCRNCLTCAEMCPSGALTVCAKEYTAQQIADIAVRHKVFYGQEGGVTLSGGEALMQPEFTASVAALCKEQGITTAIDTCGFVPKESIEMTLPYTDYYLWDIKAIDRDLHHHGCGVYNDLILENFAYLDRCQKKISVRVPVIGGFNATDREMTSIARCAAEKHNVFEVILMPYHAFGEPKYRTLGKTYSMWENAEISEEQMEHFKEIFRSMSLPVK